MGPLILAFCLFFGSTQAYPSGAPCEVLDTENLFPIGHGADAQTSESPFAFEISTAESETPAAIQAGQTYNIKISGGPEGVVLRVTNRNVSETYGTFGELPDCLIVKDCGAKGSFLTHRYEIENPGESEEEFDQESSGAGESVEEEEPESSEGQDENKSKASPCILEFQWTAPDSPPEEDVFVFQMTGVEGRATFWTDIRQELGFESAPTTPPPTSAEPSTTTTTEPSTPGSSPPGSSPDASTAPEQTSSAAETSAAAEASTTSATTVEPGV